MLKRWSIATLFLFFFWGLQLHAQVKKEGWMLLKTGDTVKGTFRHEEDRLFTGVQYRSEKGDWLELPADSIQRGELGGNSFRSLFIAEEKAGVGGHSLAERVLSGKMELYKGRYASRSCSCQDLPSIREGAFLVDEEEKLWLVKKNRWLDRLKDPDAFATAFLPFDELVKDVKDRRYAFSEIEKAVKRYNERSKDLTRSGP